jgi:serine/threonine-protein kinase
MLKGKKIRLGDLMVKLGVITAAQQEEILKIQNSVKSPIPGYEIMEKLGQGGMGAVYRGRQINMDRIVAIKTLNPQLSSQKSYVEKFLKEAKSVARLNHNNIIKGIDVGQVKGRYFFVMEFVDGPTLQEKINKDGSFAEKDALQIILQIADAIKYINQFKIVHRDIKPDNIILTSQNIPKLADLGLVLTNNETEKEVANTSATNDSHSGNTSAINTSFVGTPHYISPEQAQQKDVDFRSDIYSLGATLFHLVTGRTPFTGDRSIIIMTKHITEDLTSPRELNPALSKGIADLIFKMMEKEPSARQQSPEDLIEDIKKVIETGELPGASKQKLRSRKSKRRPALRRGRRVRRKSPSSRRSGKTKRRELEESSDGLEVTTAEFLIDEADLEPPVKVNCEDMLRQAKETKEFAKKEALLLQAMSDDSEENDIVSLEAKCRYAYLISVVRKEEAIETLLEIIEDFIEYSDNKYYGLAEKKLKELNHA